MGLHFKWKAFPRCHSCDKTTVSCLSALHKGILNRRTTVHVSPRNTCLQRHTIDDIDRLRQRLRARKALERVEHRHNSLILTESAVMNAGAQILSIDEETQVLDCPTQNAITGTATLLSRHGRSASPRVKVLRGLAKVQLIQTEE